MKRMLSVFNTDGVNRHSMLLPLAELVGSLERHLKECRIRGLPAGMPSNISHDLCRPIGWARPAGVYIAKDFARQVGEIKCWTTDDEQGEMAPLLRKYWNAHHYHEVEPYLGELEQRLADYITDNTGYCRVEAAAIARTNLAKDVYPDLFQKDTEFVDKDGLTDYDFLMKRTKQLQPGVFHEPKLDLVLFAHRFFRRNLSHHNSLNQYVLQSFHRAAANSKVKSRLRLDPDLLGHPASARDIIELEYWHGPHFDNDVSKIAPGVAEHVSTEEDRFYSGVGKTHIWWKSPEERPQEKLPPRLVRTFEVEELIEDPSAGLQENIYGCRYAHAEYDIARAEISHFDGAIRAYEADAYFLRMDCLIDRAGKQADYTKLFRFDGSIPVETWKTILTGFFRGNNLIPEYLGAPAVEAEQQLSLPDDTPEPAVLPDLSGYLGLARAEQPKNIDRHALMELKFDEEGAQFQFAEIGRGHVQKWFLGWCNSEGVNLLSAQSKTTNLATIVLSRRGSTRDDWMQVAEELADALNLEVAAGRLEQVSISIRWVDDGIETTLSIAGVATMVARLLAESRTIVRPDAVASDWVEVFRDKLRQVAPNLTAPVDWPTSAVQYGRITLDWDPNVIFKVPQGA